jgi:hypothetical protein
MADLTTLSPETTRRGGPVSARQPARQPAGQNETARTRRLAYLKWLRKMHGWIGLWGAALGLLFGSTGFLLNHRKAELHIPTGEPVVTAMQAPVNLPAPASPRALARQLQSELGIAGTLMRASRDPAHAVAWGTQRVVQPEHWQIQFGSPRETTQIDYWVGNPWADVKRNQNGLFAFLLSLHRGAGTGLGWMLVTDSLAGSLIFLSLTGVLLWSALHKRRLIGAALIGASVGAAVIAVCLS